jgi:hypothetical protein
MRFAIEMLLSFLCAVFPIKTKKHASAAKYPVILSAAKDLSLGVHETRPMKDPSSLRFSG